MAFTKAGSNTLVGIVLLVGVTGRSGPSSVRGTSFGLCEGLLSGKLLLRFKGNFVLRFQPELQFNILCGAESIMKTYTDETII